jgi:hypothetical protein
LHEQIQKTRWNRGNKLIVEEMAGNVFPGPDLLGSGQRRRSGESSSRSSLWQRKKKRKREWGKVDEPFPHDPFTHPDSL